METFKEERRSATISELRPDIMIVSAAKVEAAASLALSSARRSKAEKIIEDLLERYTAQRRIILLERLLSRCEEATSREREARIKIDAAEFDLIRDLGIDPFPATERK